MRAEEPFVAKRAVILAAGVGKRLRPVTLETPKPLVAVNGVRMIDSIIGALLLNGIGEIYVVTGYMAEKFAPLAAQYPGLKLISNPWYDTCNNISSLYVAREHLRDAIILDGDQIINKPEILSPRFARSGYHATWCEGETTEWLLDVGSDGIVKSCSRTGGSRGWQLYSVSMWSAEDGDRLCRHVEAEFERGNTGIYWDDVPLFCYPREYALGIRKMEAGDVVEIDSLEELAALDPAYRAWTDVKE